MKRSPLVVSLVGIALALGFAGVAARADGGRGAAAGGAAVQPTPSVASVSAYMDNGLQWGMSHAQLTEAFNRPGGIFDLEYAPKLAKMQPGSRMQMVEADEHNRKAALAGSYVRFGRDPLGFDSTPIHVEYTYNNNEGMEWVRRLGTKQFFFFFGPPESDRLWKVYSEVPLRSGGPLGATFDEAVAKISTALGTHGRTRPAGTETPEAGKLEATTIDWQDSTTHLRLIDRSDEHLAGVVVEEIATMVRLKELRPNQPVDPFAIDPSTAAVTQHGVSDPNAAHAAPAPSASAGGRHH